MSDEDQIAAGIMPDGWVRWYCRVCTASCTFEAMQWCARTADCGFDVDRPFAMERAFEFVIGNTRED